MTLCVWLVINSSSHDVDLLFQALDSLCTATDRAPTRACVTRLPNANSCSHTEARLPSSVLGIPVFKDTKIRIPRRRCAGLPQAILANTYLDTVPV
jgi:hypothetical protein